LLDFGLAKTLLDADKTVTVSLDGDIVGTPAFMSPEQAAGHPDAIDTRTDVYSLGIIIFNVLTHKWPYELPGSRYALLTTIQQQEPIRPRKIIPRFDSDLEAIVLKALAKEPDERYQSVAELANDIQNWLKGFPITARSISSIYLLKKMIVRHRKTSAVAGLVLVILLSTSFISIYSVIHAGIAQADRRLTKKSFREIARERLPVANQVALLLFLELWHDNKTPRAQGIASFFANHSRERTAAQFLLDPRAFEQKQADFREKLSAEDPSFCEFIIGEYYLKEGDEQAAVEAYKRCLNIDEDPSKRDDWFKNRATRKLTELSGREVPLESISNTEPEQ
jgi:hypothetical protein